MSADEPQLSTPTADEDAAMSLPAPPTAPAAMSTANRKRPRLDLTLEGKDKEAESGGGRERKRGKSMFGLLVGTLNKAKVEDSERNKSEAARKRQLTEQRLQDRLRKETDSVRRAEEVKKDKTSANRKEEDLQLKDSIHKLRRTRLPLLANFLSTADHIPNSSDDASEDPSKNPLVPLPKSHPPPLYYLPAILTPEQEHFIKKRKAEISEAAEKEWTLFKEERTTGVDEILTLRKRVAEEDARKKSEQQHQRADSTAENDQDVNMGDADAESTKRQGDVEETKAKKEPAGESGMAVDDESKSSAPPPTTTKSPQGAAAKTEAKATPAVQPAKREAMQTDEDDAVEY